VEDNRFCWSLAEFHQVLPRCISFLLSPLTNQLARYIAHVCIPSFQLSLVISHAHLVDPNKPDAVPARDRLIEKLIVKFDDVVVMSAVNADTKYGEVGELIVYYDGMLADKS